MTVAQALARYDATARKSTLLGVVHDELRAACVAAGMPLYPFQVVAWARAYVAGESEESLARLGRRQP